LGNKKKSGGILHKREDLIKFWEIVHNRNGWLWFLVDRLGLTQEEEHFLEDLDNKHRENMKSAQERRRRWDTHAKIADLKKEMGEWGRGRRKEYLNNQIKDLKMTAGKLCMKNPTRHEEAMIKDWEEEILKIQKELNYLNKPVANNALSQESIERARDFPLSKLLEREGVEVRKGFILCPLHEDTRPSMSAIALCLENLLTQ
jgi:hypothetical protein